MQRNLYQLLTGLLFLIAICFNSVLLAQGTLSGNVTDTEGDELIGVNIIVDNSAMGTTTDLDGNYTLSLPAGDHALTISYIGYTSQNQTITIKDSESITLDFSLQADNLSLSELVVTGTFSGRSQKESPISMTYINGAQLARLTSNSQADILRTIPGVTAEGGGGEVASNVFIRGLPSGGQYQFTPLQLDGVPILSTFGLNSSAHDVYFRNDIGIRNLEFVRGGASTLFGAGSVAGIINYSSITGTANQENKVQMEWAQGGRAKLDVLSAGPLSENTFYAVSGFFRYDEGPLETGLPTRGYQLRGNLKHLFNNGKSSFTIYTQLIDDNVQFYLPYPLDNSDGNRERPIGNDGEEIFTLLTSQATAFSFETPNGVFETPIENGVSTQGGLVMLDLKHNFGDNWKISSKIKSAKYDHWFNLFLDGDGVHNTPESQENYLSDRDLPTNATFTYVDDGTTLAADDLLFQNRVLDRERPMQELVGEFNLTKQFGDHSVTIGTFLSDTKAEDNNWIWNYLGDFSNSPRMVGVTYTDSNGVAQTFSNDGFISGAQTSNNVLESVKTALYIADEYQGEKFNFDIGVRIERASGTIVKETGIGTNTFNKGKVSATDFAIALAGLYKINDKLNIYLNGSRGYFFPELRGIKFASPGVPQTYETEGIIQAELGTKYSSDKISATAALFFVALNDRRSVDFINNPDNPTELLEETSVQSTRTVGIEVNANYRIVSGLNLYGNATYQAHEFTEVEGNPDQVGNELRRQPNFMGNLGVTYEKSGFDIDLSGSFLGSKFANDANTVELDGFTIVRASAGYRFTLGDQESLRLGLAVFNLLDAAGITEGSPRQGNIQGTDGEFFVGRPILPRRLFIRAGFDF